MKKLLFVFLVSLLTLVGCSSKVSTEYRSDLQSVVDNMLEYAAEAETILNKFATVWSHSIESGGAIPVNEMAELTAFTEEDIRKHFEINNAGNIPNDFSTNIHSLSSYYTESGELGRIEDASEEIKNKINELNDPPEEFKKIYDEILDMYTYTEEYIEMALNPSGSLQSFNEARDRLSSDILGKYKRIEVLMPSED